MPLVTSASRFVLNGRNSDVTMADFVEWYYSNTTAPAVRSILAEYIVVSAIGAVGSNNPRHIHLHSESIINYRGYRLTVESAAYLESADPAHQLTFHSKLHEINAQMSAYSVYLMAQMLMILFEFGLMGFLRYAIRYLKWAQSHHSSKTYFFQSNHV